MKVKQRKRKTGSRRSESESETTKTKVIKYALNIFLIRIIIIKFNAYLIHIVIK